jgi:hypothetical protein
MVFSLALLYATAGVAGYTVATLFEYAGMLRDAKGAFHAKSFTHLFYRVFQYALVASVLHTMMSFIDPSKNPLVVVPMFSLLLFGGFSLTSVIREQQTPAWFIREVLECLCVVYTVVMVLHAWPWAITL